MVDFVSVYVDDMRAPFGRMIMCHMIADTSDELREMARRIGVSERWIQKEGTTGEHFDISLSKRALAISAGAIPVTWFALSRMVLYRDRHPTSALLYAKAQPDLFDNDD